jgi:hypothetical protein
MLVPMLWPTSGKPARARPLSRHNRAASGAAPENSPVLTPGGKPAQPGGAAAATCVSIRVPVSTFSELVLLSHFF